MLDLYIDEECGYRLWACHCGMSEEQLIEWWEKLETVSPYFYNPARTLELGDIFRIDFDTWDAAGKIRYFMHLHTDGDSYLCIGDKTYFHKGYDPNYFGAGKE